ncbi:MAG TPA: S8 family serine peptidase [Bryobacteraceae bacterium]|nr:S8 family serine peptidase [Bryobacteraceae bacterium]
MKIQYTASRESMQQVRRPARQKEVSNPRRGLTSTMQRFRLVVSLSFTLICAGAAERIASQYALILSDAPLAKRSALEMATSLAGRKQRIVSAQAGLKTTLAARQIHVIGAVQTVLNAVFVEASKDRVAELKTLPGVADVVPLRRYKPLLNVAVPLMNGPGAWTSLGSMDSAGRGMKIAIIDTGIDQNHPAFQDATLTAPAGYPICSGNDCAFTNNKVIVARSYVAGEAAGTQPNPANDSRPDDVSPRDRVGHGTAVASAAAGNLNTGTNGVAFSGIAPHAFLGNYKVFGSTGLNGGATDAGIIQAVEDALNDGMDIAELSLGGPAISGPLDTGAACGLSSPNSPCDPSAMALENAVQAGMIVVAAGGNEGQDGSTSRPALSTADSPGDAPSVIAAGASTNGHVWIAAVRVPGSDAPGNLQAIPALFSDGPLPQGPLTAPMRDVQAVNNDPTGCTAPPTGSLAGTIALVELGGTCRLVAKIQNAQNAGAVGVILWSASTGAVATPTGLTSTQIPSEVVGNASGLALKSFLSTHPDHVVTMDPRPFEDTLDATANTVVSFSSRGPATGTSALIKPDVVAVGTDLYMAAQSFDAQGGLYSADGYTVADGTSFSTPLTAGAAAMVKQKNPGWTPTQVKSAIVNNASHVLNGTVTVLDAGGGKLDAGSAVNASVTAEPATVSFGILNNASLPLSQAVKITNLAGGSASLSVAVAPRTAESGAHVSADQSALSLGPGQSATINLSLSGQLPAAGEYDGVVNITGGGASIHIPYLYLMGDGVPADMIDLTGGFPLEGTVGQPIPADQGGLGFKLIDRYGVPVAGQTVHFSAGNSGAQIIDADTQTDSNGLAGASAILSQQQGTQLFTGSAGGFSVTFSAYARFTPAIAAGGALNAASFESTIAPGSYMAIFGTALSDVTDQAAVAALPPALDEVSVSFDVPSAGLSVPGYIYYVSATQINLQVPWELQGQSSALMKVRVGESVSSVITVPLASYSPSFFEFTEPGSSVAFADARDLTFSVIGSNNPAKRGQVIQLYVNGLGPVSNQPASGVPAPSQPLPLAETTSKPAVMIGGVQAEVGFTGLTPGLSGLYQINVTVPGDAPTGVQPVTISIGGVNSKTSHLPIQ